MVITRALQIGGKSQLVQNSATFSTHEALCWHGKTSKTVSNHHIPATWHRLAKKYTYFDAGGSLKSHPGGLCVNNCYGDNPCAQARKWKLSNRILVIHARQVDRNQPLPASVWQLDQGEDALKFPFPTCVSAENGLQICSWWWGISTPAARFFCSSRLYRYDDEDDQGKVKVGLTRNIASIIHGLWTMKSEHAFILNIDSL